MHKALADFICCPSCKGELASDSREHLKCDACDKTYPIVEGIPVLLCELDDVGSVVKKFYEEQWQEDDRGGTLACVTHNVDFTDLGQRYVEENESRFTSLFGGGKYFLDAGCGAYPRPEFSSGYTHHLCVDLSVKGMLEARRKLGDRGLYVIGSILDLPIKPEVVDGVLASHCIYHIEKDLQSVAIKEMHRVLRAGAAMAIFYSNPSSPEKRLISVVGSIAKIFKKRSSDDSFYFHPLPPQQFRKLLSDYFDQSKVDMKTLRFLGRGSSRLLFRLPGLGAIGLRTLTALERSILADIGELSSYVVYTATR